MISTSTVSEESLARDTHKQMVWSIVKKKEDKRKEILTPVLYTAFLYSLTSLSMAASLEIK